MGRSSRNVEAAREARIWLLVMLAAGGGFFIIVLLIALIAKA
jgi:hypothetical protein